MKHGTPNPWQGRCAVKTPDRFLQRWGHRFACAGRGLFQVLRDEPSGRVHVVAVLLVGALGIWLHLPALEWAVLGLAAAGVVAAEALNTAIERLSDRVSKEEEEAIRVVKDMAAGGVLAATAGAVLAGLMVLGPRLWELFAG